jgi:hypothetical protein
MMEDDLSRWLQRETQPRAMARAMLTGGPFDGDEAALIPPDTAAPIQIVWSGWAPWGFDAWLYEYRGERRGDPIDQLVFRPTGRRLAPEEIPPLIADTAELWVDSTVLVVSALDIPAELIWPGR